MTNKTINFLALAILILLYSTTVLAQTLPSAENKVPTSGATLYTGEIDQPFECYVTKGSPYPSNDIRFSFLLVYNSDTSIFNISKDYDSSNGSKYFTVYVPYGDYSYQCGVIDKALNIAAAPEWSFTVDSTTTTTTTSSTTTTSTIPEETTSTTTSSTTSTTRGSGGGSSSSSSGGGGSGGFTPSGGGNCFDGLKNCHHHQCEEDVDCGGPCDPCPSCSDGIQNQGEKGIDCGGPCPPCPTTTTTTSTVTSTTEAAESGEKIGCGPGCGETVHKVDAYSCSTCNIGLDCDLICDTSPCEMDSWCRINDKGLFDCGCCCLSGGTTTTTVGEGGAPVGRIVGFPGGDMTLVGLLLFLFLLFMLVFYFLKKQGS